MGGYRIRRGEISLGDLVNAVLKLAPKDEQHVVTMAKCLGFGLDPLEQSTLDDHRAPVIPGPARDALRQRQPVFRPPPFTPEIGMPPAPEPVPDNEGPILQLVPDDVSPISSGGESIARIPADALEARREPAKPELARQPILPGNKARALLQELVSRQVAGPIPDFRRLLDQLARRKPLPCFPYLPRRTVLNGCQLLLDFSDSLVPLWPDMRELKEQFHSLLDRETCPVYRFKSDPFTAFIRKDRQKESWKPVGGKPVIVASDLGQISVDSAQFQPTVATWLRFVHYCEQNHASVIAMVPVGLSEERLQTLSRVLRIVPWHPLTTATAVKALMVRSGKR